MNKNKFKTFLNGTRNDFKIAVDDIFNAIEVIYEDVELLKLKNSKPDKLTAKVLLDYLSWEEGKSKQNLEKHCGKEIQEYLKWLNYHCDKEGMTKEQALREIVDGKM